MPFNRFATLLLVIATGSLFWGTHKGLIKVDSHDHKNIFTKRQQHSNSNSVSNQLQFKASSEPGSYNLNNDCKYITTKGCIFSRMQNKHMRTSNRSSAVTEKKGCSAS
jgi:hypothetical protein